MEKKPQGIDLGLTLACVCLEMCNSFALVSQKDIALMFSRKKTKKKNRLFLSIEGAGGRSCVSISHVAKKRLNPTNPSQRKRLRRFSSLEQPKKNISFHAIKISIVV